MNFTASWLNYKKMKILDDLDNNIASIRYVTEVYPFKYSSPTVTYDIIEPNKPKAQLLIDIVDFKKLEKYGFRVVIIPITKEEAWLPRQKNRYALIRLKDPNTAAFKSLKSGQGYYTKAIVDEANLLIKLVGPKVSKFGDSGWIKI